MSADGTAPRVRIRDLVGYFLRLGALGFGGPVALCGQMERELVEQRRQTSSSSRRSAPWLTDHRETAGARGFRSFPSR